MRRVLALLGVDDSGLVVFQGVNASGLNIITVSGCINPLQELDHPQLDVSRLILGGSNATDPGIAPGSVDVLFNMIADADRSTRSLALAEAFIRRTRPAAVINHPARILQTRRDDIARRLAGISGLVVPQIHRIKPVRRQDILDALADGPVTFPAILRKTGTHNGDTMLLLRSPADAHRLERIACDGSEYYLIEYVDYRSADGYFRKMRIAMIGGRPYPRHLLASKYWNVHASVRTGVMSRGNGFIQDETRFLSNFDKQLYPKLAERLAALHAQIRLDYYAIDCTLLPGGEMPVFEANAGVNLLQQPGLAKYPHLRRPLQRLRKAVERMLLEAPGSAVEPG